MFKPQFAPAVESGAKRQTIRPTPKRPQDVPKVGNLESWREWTGLPYRSKQRELAKVRLIEVREIAISESSIKWRGIPANAEQLAEIVRRDGFSSWHEMREWFEKTHGLPFTGILIRAEDCS